MKEGEIVEVQGGHIVRSTGRKDRHSKVCTAKGTRDRRVRLSALTAIQFYDVQDRLGYDRPSKAVDWLITKAKASIDALAHLPPWDPHSSHIPSRAPVLVDEQGQVGAGGETSVQTLNPHSTSSSFLLPTMDSDAIKSFFPIAPQSQFHNYPPDLVSRSSSHSQDLRLSLHSFQDQNLQHQHEQSLFSGTAHLGFDAEMGRLVSSSWNNAGADNSGAFTFTTPATTFSSQNQYISQRGPLQSNNTPWMDHTSGHQFPFQSSSAFPFSGAFNIPTREEEHSNKPSSASSD